VYSLNNYSRISLPSSSTHKLKRRREANSRESGATIVEFALVLPLLLLLIVGLIDFGRMGFVEVSITSASREGARLSSFYPSGPAPGQEITTLVEEAAPGAASTAQLNGNGVLSVSVIPCSSTIAAENTSVTVATNFIWLLPIDLIKIISPGSTLGEDFNLSSSSAMRCGN
jgi:Flp pilus assembly protein TadG